MRFSRNCRKIQWQTCSQSSYYFLHEIYNLNARNSTCVLACVCYVWLWVNKLTDWLKLSHCALFKIWFYACLSIFLWFLLFFLQVSDSLSLLLYSLHVRLLRASIKINQSINQVACPLLPINYSRFYCVMGKKRVHSMHVRHTVLVWPAIHGNDASLSF